MPGRRPEPPFYLGGNPLPPHHRPTGEPPQKFHFGYATAGRPGCPVNASTLQAWKYDISLIIPTPMSPETR